MFFECFGSKKDLQPIQEESHVFSAPLPDFDPEKEPSFGVAWTSNHNIFNGHMLSGQKPFSKIWKI